MKKTFTYVFCFLLILFARGSSQMSAGENIRSSSLGGAVLESYRKLVIPSSGFDLSENTIIRLDEMVLEGPLVTHGFALQIDVQRLIFSPGGKIIAFTQASSQGPVGNPGMDGSPGSSADGRGNRGEDGHAPLLAGGKGATGQEGLQTPGQISIFAQSFEGKPEIVGIGQKGGTGGIGGKGGKGGRGGNGSLGEARCWPFGPDKKGGDGGTGGAGGKGGLGGDGGKGGKAVSIEFIFGKSENEHTRLNSDLFSDIISQPGSGGEPGKGGEGGEPGDGGSPGGAHSTVCGVFFSDSVEGGNPGSIGPLGSLGDVGNVPGFSGDHLNGNQSVPDIRDLSEVEKQRSHVYQSFFRFHVSRTLFSLIEDSIRLASVVKFTREEVRDRLAQGDLSVFNSINKKYINSVITDWKDHFLQPISEKIEFSKSDISLYERLKEAQDLGNQVVSLMENLLEENLKLELISEKLENLLTQSQQSFQNDLNLALGSCNDYNQVRRNRHDDMVRFVFGMTGHYEIPPCNKNPDFTKPENAFQPFILKNFFTTLVSSPELSKKIEIIEPQVLSLRSDIKSDIFSFFTSAFASEYQVILIHGESLSEEQLLQSIPGNSLSLSTYQLTAISQVTRENLALHLHASTILLSETGIGKEHRK